MMKLSVMKQVVETVDQDWRSPFAEQLLEKWGFDGREVYYYRGSANFIFVFKREDKWYFLRCNVSTERKMADYQSEIDLLKYLEEATISVAKVVPSNDGNLIETVDTDLGTYYCVVFEAVEGEMFEIEQLDEKAFYTWGKTLGQLHEVFKRMPKHIKEGRSTWKDHLQFVKDTIPSSEIAAQNERVKVEQWLTNLSVSDDTYGLIHYDFELDNLKWKEDCIGILDFDDCVQHWYVADIAYALRDLFEKDLDLEHPKFKKFMEGYLSMTCVDQILLKDIAWFMRLHNLVMFARLYRSLNLKEEETNPQWLSDLMHKFEAKLETYRTSFLIEK